MQGLLTGKFSCAGEVPEGRARTKHFAAQNRPKIRHGENGHESSTFAAIEAIRQVSEETALPISIASLAALLNQPGIITAVVGARNATQVRQNAEALRRKIDRPTIDKLFAATDALKNEIGPEVDLWMSPSRIQ